MEPIIIDGKKISKIIKDELKQEIIEKKISPGLGIILVGDRKDSQTYVRMKKRACDYVGIKNFDIHLPDTISEKDLINEVNKMNDNPKIHAILIQLPLPKHINEANVLNNVKESKDVDGFHVQNIGKLALKRMNNLLAPCTPEGCIELLKRYNLQIEGKHAVIVGRSNIVGMPLSLLLLHNNATVSICHSKTLDIYEHTKKADILVLACGNAQFIKAEHIKNNCVIIDIGINAIDDSTKKRGYRLVGDCDFDSVKHKVKAITPVPGGVGPMTIATLLSHTIKCCLNN